MAHILNISTLNTADGRFIKIQDNSWYDPAIPITNASLRVFIPGNTTPFYFNFIPNSVWLLTSNSFNITANSNANNLSKLPDGIYEYTYSVCPNEQVWVTLTEFRTFALKQRIDYLFANFKLDTNLLSNMTEFEQDIVIGALDSILILFQLLQSCSNAGNFNQAQNLYNFITNKIVQLSCSKGCSTIFAGLNTNISALNTNCYNQNC